jgi:hypothetical protein
MENRIEVGPLLASVREILSGATKPILAYVAAMTVVFTLMDLYNAESGHFTVSSIGSTVAGYLLMRALVLQTELAAEGEVAGFGSYFGLGLLEGLAYLVGAILLIVPAIVLMIRWTPSIPLLMCEKRGVAQSMDLSWKATKGNFWVPFPSCSRLRCLSVCSGMAIPRARQASSSRQLQTCASLQRWRITRCWRWRRTSDYSARTKAWRKSSHEPT